MVYESGIGLLAIAFVILALFLIFTRRTNEYKKSLSDLYVAGRIRQISTENKVNLNEEYENFKQWTKKNKMEDLSLDKVVEEELKEELAKDKKKK